MSTFREDSKGNWDSTRTTEHINAGSLQRIADACEKMSADHDRLKREKESAEQSRDYWRKRSDMLENRVRGLRSRITVLKHRALM